MANHFEVMIEDLQLFDGYAAVGTFKVTGGYDSREDYTIDLIEAQSDSPSVRGDWWRITHLHPMWRCVDHWLDSDEGKESIDAIIKADMELVS